MSNHHNGDPTTYAPWKKKKYVSEITIDPNNLDPRLTFHSLRKQTQLLSEIYGTRRHVTVMVRTDIHKYLCYKMRFKNDSSKMWVAGDSLFFVQNPRYSVLVKSFCVKTKKWCCGAEGNISNEYFAVCPHCNRVFVAVRDSDIPCDTCMKMITASQLKKIGWVRFGCVNCPANIGLDQANKFMNYAKARTVKYFNKLVEDFTTEDDEIIEI